MVSCLSPLDRPVQKSTLTDLLPQWPGPPGGLPTPALPSSRLRAWTPGLPSPGSSCCGPHLGSGAGGGAGAGAGAGVQLGSDVGEAGPCLPHRPRPSPSPRPQGGPGSWPTLFKLPMSTSLQLCRSEQSPAFSLGRGGGSPVLALAPPLSHTQWDRNKAAGRL